MSGRATSSTTRVTVRNIGGISERAIELSQGVTVLSGTNATNRTSLLKALAAAQGSEAVSLRGTADEGSVKLSYDGEQYHRTIRRVDDSLGFDGECPVDPEDRDVAERFAFLFEDNRARQAIRRGENLHDVVMGPVDTDEIEAEIAALKREREQQERELDELESLQAQLPSLRERRDELEEQKASLEDEIAAKESEIEAAEETVDESEAHKTAVDEQVAELRTYQSDLEATESKLETTEGTIDELEAELADTQAELRALDPVDTAQLEELTAELDTLHERVAEKERMMSELQNIIQFNKEYLEGEGQQYPDALGGTDADAVTGQLVDGDHDTVCWTCGSPTSESNIADTVDRLQGLHEDLHGEREQLRDRIDELQGRKDDLEQRRDRRGTLQDAITDIEGQLGRQRERLTALQDQRERLQDDVETAEAELATLREEQQGEILEHHRELNELEFELQQTTDEYDSVCTEIAAVESELEGLDSLRSDIEATAEDIEFLRERVETIEREVIDSFNEHMEAILAKLAYGNLERIWLDRQTTAQRDDTQFELHVIRTDDDGAPYEDTVTNLSESEREVTGLIFALAGYLAHDVHEKAPFMLLDSLEAIDRERIGLLLEYLGGFAKNIVVALLEEDARALPMDYTTIAQSAQQ